MHMRMDYSNLWKLLIEKNMTKTDLINASGISSRVIAKISKNQTVTTDTILRLCETLNCRVEDIMTCVGEKKLSLSQAYRDFGKTVEENDFYKTVSFSWNEKRCTVHVSKNRAGKATHIECREDSTVYWIQFYPFGSVSGPSRAESVLIRPTVRKGETVFVVIKGKPGLITGLDEGIFVSSRGRAKSQDCVYVMSESAFKLFGTNESPS